MITELSDEILERDFSDDEIAAYIVDYYGQERAPPEASIAHYIAALRMEPALREGVFKLFRSAPLLCRECGKPSCLHGYSDD